jgi:hypothetical protein
MYTLALTALRNFWTARGCGAVCQLTSTMLTQLARRRLSDLRQRVPPVPPRCEKDAATAQRLHHLTPNLTLEEFEALPTVLFGTAVQIAEKLHVHRKCYGFSYITVLEGAMEPFAKVIELLRGS